MTGEEPGHWPGAACRPPSGPASWFRGCAVVAKLNGAFAKAPAMPEVKDRILSQSNQLGGGSPGDFTSFINAETPSGRSW